MLAHAGVSTNDIKTLIGHSNYAFTADVYTHLNIDDLCNAIRQIEK